MWFDPTSQIDATVNVNHNPNMECPMKIKLNAKTLDGIIKDRGADGVAEVKSAIQKADGVYNNGKKVSYSPDAVYTAFNKEKTMTGKSKPETKNTPKPVNKGREFWREAFKTMQHKSVAGYTTTSDVSGGIVDALEPIFTQMYEDTLTAFCTRINMSSPTVRIPQLKVGSGAVATTVEGSGKPSIKAADDVVTLDAKTYAAHIPMSNQTLDDLPAFESVLPELIKTEIQAKLDQAVVDSLLSASGRYAYSGVVSGVPTPSQLDEALSHIPVSSMRSDRTKILVHPSVWSEIMNWNSGVALVQEGPVTRYRGLELIPTPFLTAPASGASGTVVIADMSKVAFGVKGDLAEEFNPYYGWDQNVSDIRVEGRFDVEPMTVNSWSRSGAGGTGYSYAYYVSMQ